MNLYTLGEIFLKKFLIIICFTFSFCNFQMNLVDPDDGFFGINKQRC